MSLLFDAIPSGLHLAGYELIHSCTCSVYLYLVLWNTLLVCVARRDACFFA